MASLSVPLMLLCMFAVNAQEPQQAVVNASSTPSLAERPKTEVRLVGGENEWEGRVEVRLAGSDEWGTVCDDGWGVEETALVCRMIGRPDAVGVTRMSAAFGEGGGMIILDDVQCNGNESDIVDCAHSEVGESNCQHSEDVGVVCLSTEDGIGAGVDVRLSGSLFPWQGHVQVRAPGDTQWGTACVDGVNRDTANVICRSLNYSAGAVDVTDRPLFDIFNRADLPYAVFLRCLGNETSVEQCTAVLLNADQCETGAPLVCDSGADGDAFQMRLRGGASANAGRLEVSRDGNSWYVLPHDVTVVLSEDQIANNRLSVCSNGWSDLNSRVACRHLNQNGQAISGSFLYSGLDKLGSVLKVQCYGDDRRPTDCLVWGAQIDQDAAIYSETCTDDDEEVGLLCLGEDQAMPELEVRLVGGKNQFNGRVEVSIAGTDAWGTVCDDNWGDKDAKVVCRMLGRVGPVRTRGTAVFGEGSGPIMLDDVDCNGNEDNIGDCKHSGLGENNCGHGEDVGLTCFGDDDDVDYEVSIATGGSLFSLPGGRLRVRRPELSDDWSSVCADGWSDENSAVACRMLGDGSNSDTFAHVSRAVARGGEAIQLTSAACLGDEASLKDCPRQKWGANECSVHNAVHLTCNADPNVPEKTAQVRLSGGAWPWEGTVQVRALPNGEWGSVCDDSWDENDAKVICRMLGMEGGTARSGAFFGQGTGTIYLDDVECDGDEESIADCRRKEGEANCAHSEDAGVTCTPSSDAVLALLQNDDAKADDNPIMQAIRQAITLSTDRNCLVSAKDACPPSGFIDLPSSFYEEGNNVAFRSNATMTECRQMCAGEEQCRGFTHHTENRGCWLKSQQLGATSAGAEWFSARKCAVTATEDSVVGEGR